jgi:cellulose biosynthesis protein BcsQ
MTDVATAAVVGATGGAGTTRIAVELATTLARADRSVAVVDAAFATQGLEQYVRGNIDRDVTRLVTEDTPHPESWLVTLPTETPGRVRVAPAYAAFERLARAKTATAAERLGDLVADLADDADHVLVDTPPVASNQAVAAVTSADRVALVAPASQRGTDAVQRASDRLADVDASVDRVFANRTAEPYLTNDRRDPPVPGADVGIPESDTTSVAGAPVCADPSGADFEPAVARAAEALFETDLGLSFPERGLLGGMLARR